MPLVIFMKKKLIVSSLLFLLVSLSSSYVYSQAGTKGLTVIPPRFELLANPGDIVSEKIRIKNDSDFPVNYQVVVEDFASSGEEGAVVLEEESSDQSFSLAKWISPELNELILQPQEERVFTYSINVARTAEPGGHYASILFTSNPTQNIPGAANVASRVGSLILLRVSGNVDEKAVIETFEAPAYSQKGPIPFTLRVKNNGNVHVQPKGTIIITNLFGKKVDEVPLKSANVLPGSVRKTETFWDKQNLLGSYTATLVATYGQQNLPLTAASNFMVASPLSVGLIITAGAALILFIISLFSSRSRIRRALKALTTGK